MVEAAFCWNKSYVPAFKWRLAHLNRLPDCPASIREGVASLAIRPPTAALLAIADTLVQDIKHLVSDRFEVSAARDEPLSSYAHEIHAGIGNAEVRQATALDW